jgi:hypothetical protein
MMNNKCIALAVIVALAVACMPAQVEAQSKEQWATFLTELYVKDQLLNGAGLGNDWTSWAGTPQWGGLGDWGSAFNWATPYLGGFGRRLMGAAE